MSTLTNFDLVAVGNQIVALETEARDKLATANQAAQVDHRRRSEQIAALLHSVEENAPKSILDICKRAGIGRSRRFELLKIGRGDKTAAQSRKQDSDRHKKSRATKAKKKIDAKPASEAKPVHDGGAIMDSSPKAAGNGTDPDASAATMKAAHAANEGNGKAKSASKPKPITSAKALSEIKERVLLLKDLDLIKAGEEFEKEMKRRGLRAITFDMPPNNSPEDAADTSKP
jgi:hypothetical protein